MTKSNVIVIKRTNPYMENYEPVKNHFIKTKGLNNERKYS